MYNSTGEKRHIDITDRTFNFGARIIRLSKFLPKDAAGFAVARQIVRSGTSVGANVEEAQNSGSKKEFIRGLTIALKEARETLYWLKMIVESELIKKIRLSALIKENIEIIKILTVIIKKAKK